MLTIFSTPKPFHGHIGVIQRNALKSWTLLDPRVEVILFGDDAGAAQAAADFGLRHEPNVSRSEHGGKHLHHIFERAQAMARHPLVCYVNCDILLPQSFAQAVRQVASLQQKLLMVGRRWDVDITSPVDFADPLWEQSVLDLAAHAGRQRPGQWIDYFLFSRGLYRDLPPMVIGRVGWDNYLIWRARQEGAAVIDASETVTAVHQNHDYAYHPQGEHGVWHDEQAKRNIELAGGPSHLLTMDDATHRLTHDGLRRNRFAFLAPTRRKAHRLRRNAWFSLLAITRPLRHPLGLRQDNLQRFLGRAGKKVQ